MKKLIISIVLALAIVFVAYKCYESIKIPQEFTIIKKQRNDRVIDRLKDVRSAEEAYRSVFNKYTASFDTLINFIKYDSVKIVRSIGALTDEQIEKGMTEAQAIKQGFIIRDVIKVAALQEIFKGKYDVNTINDLRYVPQTRREDQFELATNTLTTDSGLKVPVFEARVSNMVIFKTMDEKYYECLLEENGERLRLKKYPGLKVGDLEEANNNVGNWE
ncbi:MAG: hypothetical protein LBM07_04375 [Culturomica sp.]|jgi:hypothetical protein|nr:hypothetical protein [Culturomica sp.]